VVNEVVAPVGAAVLVVVAAFLPVEAIVVAVSPEDVVASVAIEVDHEHWATGVRKIPVAVQDPRLGRRVDFRALVPAIAEDDVFQSVPIDVAETDAMAVRPG